MFGQLHKPN